MVQVLPYVPSFLEQLTPYLNQATGSIADMLEKRAQSSNDSTIWQQIQNLAQKAQSGEGSPIDIAPLWSKLSPEFRKTQEPFLQSHLRQVEHASQSRLKQTEASHKEELKRETESKEKEKKSTSLLNVLDEMETLLKYTGTTAIPFTSSFEASEYGLNRKGLEKRNEFDNLAGSAASFFRDLETKGTLPQGLYEKVIAPRLPSSDLSERQNKGRINGIRKLAKEYGGVKNSMTSKTVNVYDASGNLAGTIDSNEINQLPEGYKVK